MSKKTHLQNATAKECVDDIDKAIDFYDVYP